MRATVTYKDKKLIVDICGVKFTALDEARFETTLTLADLPKVVQLDESALGIMRLVARFKPDQGRRAGQSPADRGGARKSSESRAGVSIWSGAASFNPRWSNLTADEVVRLGISRIPAVLWGRVREVLKTLDRSDWREQKTLWEERIHEAVRRDDQEALESQWRSFLEVTQKRAQ